MEILEAYSLSSNELESKGKYFVIGRGEPIVLLHGFAETYEIWDSIYPELSKHYKVILPQIPSCGNTASFINPFSMELIAEYVNKILEKENIKKIALFGHSMGGYASMAFAEKYPDKLIALSLVHSSAQADTPQKKNIRETAIHFIRKNGKESFIKTLIPKLYAVVNDADKKLEKHHTMANSYNNEQIISCYQAMMNRPNRKYILEGLTCPIQFIAGKEDLSVDYQDLQKQAALCKTPFLTIFEGIGHTSMHENPSLLLSTIFGFLDDIKQTKYS